MDINLLDYFLKLLKEAMDWLLNIREAARRGGLPPFDLLPLKEAVELTTAHKGGWDDEAIRIAYRRMKNRDRVRRWREKQKQCMQAAANGNVALTGEEHSVTETQNAVTGKTDAVTKTQNAVTGNENTILCNAKSVTRNTNNVTCNAITPETLQPVPESATAEESGAGAAFAAAEPGQESLFCNAAVTETGNASVTDCNALAEKEKESEKRKNQRKEINKNKKMIKNQIADAMPNSARGQEEAENGMKQETDACPPYEPETKTSRLILTRDLSETHRKVVLAWNRLPLPKKLRGLYPTMVRRLNQLFEDYGEETVHEAIDRVADSPFLLGKTKNNRGWVANLYWLLQPENLEKILSGQYQDDAPLKQRNEITPAVPEGFCGTVVY